MNILTRLNQAKNNNKALLTDGASEININELNQQVAIRVQFLKQQNCQVLGLLLDNSLDWILFDLAAQQLAIVCIPMPVFFSQAQRDHVVSSAGIDLVICAQKTLSFEQQVKSKHFISTYRTSQKHQSENMLCAYQLLGPVKANYPEKTQKVTFTSGSTGVPKGVCLSIDNQTLVAQSLMQEIGLIAPKHLCLLPLPVLLENIAGVYAPLLAGGSVVVLPQADYGFSGSALVDSTALLMAISVHQPNSLILVPELLLVLLMAVKSGWQAPKSLAFIAVGGAHVAPELLTQAHQAGLPVYQGYGLSECASVVSLNTPQQHNIHSAGKVLSHVSCEVIDGELVVSGNCHLGYLNQVDSWYKNTFHTGDLVELDDNTLIIKGRKKNLLISSFGRNINPEWPEALLFASGVLKQCVVFGDNKPHCSALLVAGGKVTEQQIQRVVSSVNAQLPDYAQIKDYLILPEPMQAWQGLTTDNNRLKRDAIYQYYFTELEALYQKETYQQDVLFHSMV
jgi:long-chain acyl-CoA synthetase